ncbi:hypothetical protein GWK47_000597 [Chionoecetes opilio]|uniref:Uncharacterized protein n=1 Tax=Chionoecetes opilio TaxID=41210 RepID=A0A8J5CYY4_CHIOP|nr:hypothetical protein GWK47_000597 [Chionoecetes opilio]
MDERAASERHHLLGRSPGTYGTTAAVMTRVRRRTSPISDMSETSDTYVTNREAPHFGGFIGGRHEASRASSILHVHLGNGMRMAHGRPGLASLEHCGPIQISGLRDAASHSLHSHQAMRGGVSGPAPAPDTCPPGPRNVFSSSLINVTASFFKYGRADYATLMPVYENLTSVDPNTSKINSKLFCDGKTDGNNTMVQMLR